MSDHDAGTEKDGTPSQKYCTYCYQNGAFTEPDLTFETMIKKYATMFASEYGMPESKSRADGEPVHQHSSQVEITKTHQFGIKHLFSIYCESFFSYNYL